MHPILPSGGNVLDFFRRGGTLPSSESHYRLLPPERFARFDPEYFPLIGGRRSASAAARSAFRCMLVPDEAATRRRDRGLPHEVSCDLTPSLMRDESTQLREDHHEHSIFVAPRSK